MDSLIALNARKRILLHGGLHRFGGIEVTVYRLALALATHGHEVTISSLSSSFFQTYSPELINYGVRCVSTGLGDETPIHIRHLVALATWHRSLRLAHFDVIISFGTGSFSYMLRPFLRKGGFFAIKECGAGHYSFFNRMKMRIAARSADAILCNCKAVAVRLSHIWSKSRLLCLHSLCAPTLLPPVSTEKHWPTERPLRISFFGRLDSSKQPDLLLRIFPRLITAFPDIRLDYYGSGPLEDSLQDAIVQANLSSRVAMHGAYDLAEDLPRLMTNTDIIALPSVDEGFGRVLVEGFAFGIPFVATNQGGPTEIAADNLDLRAVPPTEEDFYRALSEVICRYRDGTINPSALQKRYIEQYSYEVVEPQWAAFVENPAEYLQQCCYANTE